MTTEEVQSKVLSALTSLGHPNAKPESNLRTDLNLDSLDVVELGMTLEHDFSIIIPDKELAEFKTVQDSIDCVSKHLATISNV